MFLIFTSKLLLEQAGYSCQQFYYPRAFTVGNAKLNIEKSEKRCKGFTELKTLVCRKEFWQDYLFIINHSVIKHYSAKVLTANKEAKKNFLKILFKGFPHKTYGVFCLPENVDDDQSTVNTAPQRI
jgi:hypothetical protein